MEKVFLDYLTKDMPENSVKRACYIVKEFLRYSETIKNDEEFVLRSGDGCAVTLEEFLQASHILLSHSYENSDETTVAELYYCESDCSNNNGCSGFCKGEFSLSHKPKKLKLCKYYSDSQYI